MAKLIDDIRVTLGRCIRVENQNKRDLECDNYVAIQVKELNGREHCLLFTQKQLERCSIVDMNKPLELGYLYPFGQGRFCGYLLKTHIYSERTKQFFIVTRKISCKQLAIAEQRAMKNPEDLTVKGFFTNLFD